MESRTELHDEARRYAQGIIEHVLGSIISFRELEQRVLASQAESRIFIQERLDAAMQHVRLLVQSDISPIHPEMQVAQGKIETYQSQPVFSPQRQQVLRQGLHTLRIAFPDPLLLSQVQLQPFRDLPGVSIAVAHIAQLLTADGANGQAMDPDVLEYILDALENIMLDD